MLRGRCSGLAVAPCEFMIIDTGTMLSHPRSAPGLLCPIAGHSSTAWAPQVSPHSYHARPLVPRKALMI